MQTQAIISRAQNLILKPKETWTEIERTPANLQDTYVNYVIPLAALPAIAHFLGMSLIGTSIDGEMIRTPFIRGLFEAVISFGLSLVMVYVLAQVIDRLGPSFGAARNFNQAFKVAAFAPTASWVVGVLYLIPALSFFGLLGGLYSLYLLFVGLPLLMKPQADKATIYTLAVIGVAIVLSLAIAVALSLVFPVESL